MKTLVQFIFLIFYFGLVMLFSVLIANLVTEFMK